MGTFQYGYQGQAAVLSATAAGSNTVVAGVPGQRINVVNVVFVCSGTVGVSFQSGATPLTGVMPFVANTGMAPPEASFGHFRTEVGSDLVCKLSATQTVAGWVVYRLE